ncbi:hypothetical protein [Streptomyces sp. NBC_00079]|uniref:hypothetical protein n=1 Tax=Streptomyces sp. NBC_00079 TaxID=2975644 RepID=UPI0032514859
MSHQDDAASGEVDLGRVWAGVAAQVWRRPPGLVERAAGRVMRSPALARALVTTPSLLVPWLLASVCVLGGGVGATLATHTPWVVLLAPAVAATGIAHAYGPQVDPAYELSRSMAVSDRMVLLVRVLAVFAVNTVLGLAASLASAAAAGLTLAWLLPMTAVSALALAAAVVTQSPNTGVAAGLAGWCVTVLAAQRAAGSAPAVLTRGPLLLSYLALTAACAAVVLLVTRTGADGWPRPRPTRLL